MEGILSSETSVDLYRRFSEEWTFTELQCVTVQKVVPFLCYYSTKTFFISRHTLNTPTYITEMQLIQRNPQYGNSGYHHSSFAMMMSLHDGNALLRIF
jgi:hypothetical protein